MNYKPIKVSLQTHVNHLMNLYKIQDQISKHNLFPFVVLNIIQSRQICFGVKLITLKLSNMNERKCLDEIQTTNFNDNIVT